ncbi:hypothetical protein AJ80_05609 [Polytolypa hystricis UAMH7299]|uniref:DUF7730 domain-containing protein n=1 Tax=Polytolypa hystricis (strain UAMH7299) TaxID=1447883 RepID=A0A2B7Y1B5_POLH7|nr:hypothetical protein AJ80_05609 [Polytolypa hystricis UAMH7299]
MAQNSSKASRFPKLMRKYVKKLSPSSALKKSSNGKRANPSRREPDISDFPFLSFPAEIRDQVYHYVFGAVGVHIIFHKGQSRHVRCEHLTPNYGSDCCITATKTNVHLQSGFNDGQRSYKPIYTTPTSLLYVNKQIYNEASAILYRALTFHVSRLDHWVSFANTINPKHLAMIRCLRGTWMALACLTEPPVSPRHPRYQIYENYTTLSDGSFQDFWDIVASRMLGLVDLGIFMDYIGQFLSRSRTASWVPPLTKVRGLKKLEIRIEDRFNGAHTSDPDDCLRAEKEQAALLAYLTDIMCAEREQGQPAAVDGVEDVVTTDT